MKQDELVLKPETVLNSKVFEIDKRIKSLLITRKKLVAKITKDKPKKYPNEYLVEDLETGYAQLELVNSSIKVNNELRNILLDKL